MLLPVFVCVKKTIKNLHIFQYQFIGFVRSYIESNILPFSLRSVSMPPKLTNEIFQSNSKTFFIGKCGAVPPQKRVIMFNSLTASNSSPIGASEKLAKYHQVNQSKIFIIIVWFLLVCKKSYSVHLKMFRQYL